ncbi:hypothetical protein T07_4623 [Trichinella nelsoni]|uniref:Integrase catalytic domain-containing protein n=1 Tax=Trichinella nelsoni TaxID=6336 RepID=A0A0V0S704_9BILA|nr:hypothetical protein T07_4623 [Trichinella nelsoni]
MASGPSLQASKLQAAAAAAALHQNSICASKQHDKFSDKCMNNCNSSCVGIDYSTCNSDSQILLITLLPFFLCRSSETRLLRYYGPCSCCARRLLCSIGDRALLCCAGRLTHRRDSTLDSVLDLYNCAQHAQAVDAPGVFFGSDGIFNSLASNVEWAQCNTIWACKRYRHENSKLKASCGIQLEIDDICGQTINQSTLVIRVFFFSTSSVSYASFCLFFAQRNVTDESSELQLTLSGILDEVFLQFRDLSSSTLQWNVNPLLSSGSSASADPQTASSTVEWRNSVARTLLSNWIARFEVSSHITIDRGRQFNSQLWSTVTEHFSCKQIATSAYHPQSNGLGIRWAEALPLVHLGLRSAVKPDLGHVPSELIYGSSLGLPASSSTSR